MLYLLRMRRFFVKSENITENEIVINEKEFEHLHNVLRLRENDKLVCFSGDGLEYFCSIKQILPSKAICQIEKIEKSKTATGKKITLFQGALKSDKFEFVIQKMSELGLNKVVPFESAFSVAKVKSEKIDRYQKIATEASKQCQRADVLEVGKVLTLKQLAQEIKNYDLVLFAYEKEDENSLANIKVKDFENIALIVGSEGGFSEKEAQTLIQAGAKSISLGKRILRAETAPITLASIVMFLLGEI